MSDSRGSAGGAGGGSSSGRGGNAGGPLSNPSTALLSGNNTATTQISSNAGGQGTPLGHLHANTGAGVNGRERIDLGQSTRLGTKDPSPVRRDFTGTQPISNNPSSKSNTTLAPNTPNILSALGPRSLKPRASARSARSSREPSPTRTNERKPLYHRSGTPTSSTARGSGTGPSQSQGASDSQARTLKPISGGPQNLSSSRLNISKSPHSRSPSLSSRQVDTQAPNTLQSTQTPEKPTLEITEDTVSAGLRSPISYSLETVIESSLPSTPAIGSSKVLGDHSGSIRESRSETATESSSGYETEKPRSIAPSRSAQESESESGYRSGEKGGTIRRSGTTAAQSKAFGKRMALPVDTSSNMTVETETVTSVLPPTNPGNVGTSLRSKRSNDTIRAPKKEKRRVKRSAPVAANPSSRADMFAAKLAEAVDQNGEESDSDETFVYESNPREPPQRPSSRFHSRTPSATSMHSAIDQRVRTIPLYAPHEGSKPRSMKFVNPNQAAMSDAGEGYGIAGPSEFGLREAFGSRHGYMSGQEDSRYYNKHHSTLRRAPSHISSRNSSRPTSPRNSNGPKFSNVKRGHRLWNRFDADADGDDERVPLIPQRRVVRPYRRNGMPPSRQRTRGWFGRFASCFIALFTVLFVFAGAITFLFTTTKSLQAVELLDITDVLVSKEEIMLELIVKAINPNVIAVTVTDMDINLFAKSAYVGEKPKEDPPGGDTPLEPPKEDPWAVPHTSSSSLSRRSLSEFTSLTPPIPSYSNSGSRILNRSPLAPTLLHRIYKRDTEVSNEVSKDLTIAGNRDDGTNPMPDPEEDKQTMLLGRIFQFDSPLVFEGSPFNHFAYNSSGEIRLPNPGNKTETGGSDRWERVIAHPFELIVRGVLKYQVPLSGRLRTAVIGGKVKVTPGKDSQGDLGKLLNGDDKQQ